MEIKRITEEKYMDTDIDSLVLHFDDTKEESVVKEFDIPDEYKYMVFISEKKKSKRMNWIEIVNPSEILSLNNPVLPDLEKINYNKKDYELLELIKHILQ